MAVDTAAKRRSMVSMGDALVGEQVPASGNLGTAVRRGASSFLYAGIAAGAPVAPVVPKNFGRRRTATFIKRNADIPNRTAR